MVRSVAATACVAAMLWGCAPEPQPFEEKPLATEEIGGGFDAGLSTDEDEKGTILVRAGGVLPGDFPKDLPLPRAYTVVDFGPGAEVGDREEDRYLVVQSAEPQSSVREHLAGRLAALGWTVEPRNDGLEILREARRVRWVLSDTRPGTRVEIRY